MSFRRLVLPCLALMVLCLSGGQPRAVEGDRHLLYVATPGIRNYVEYGGAGILVYDMSDGHRLLRRIPTFDLRPGEDPENIKGIAANAETARLYVTTTRRVAAFDLTTDTLVWNREYEGGTDRLALSPDGRILYVPSFEGPHWHVIDAASGDVITRIETGSGAHNTIFASDGSRVYLAGLKSPVLSIADPRTHTLSGGVGPFTAAVRPFTVNARQTLCFVNVNGLLGFEVGDIRTGRMLHRVEVQGFDKGPIKRHGCPSHGIALTPDEKELWLADGSNSRVHIFDATAMPPRQVASLAVRDQPGWITFSIDGRHGYPSTGEVVDTRTRRILTILRDEDGGTVQSEKMVEVVFTGSKPVRTGDQFGIGRQS
jgi:hypothetical protein